MAACYEQGGVPLTAIMMGFAACRAEREQLPVSPARLPAHSAYSDPKSTHCVHSHVRQLHVNGEGDSLIQHGAETRLVIGLAWASAEIGSTARRT